jgi:hypothetical protein
MENEVFDDDATCGSGGFAKGCDDTEDSTKVRCMQETDRLSDN